uniref:Uncharacterized protein n=1 Tax=Panagrolaimus superbus TaxID=310955 RepID=A0A914YNJ0_9BILA
MFCHAGVRRRRRWCELIRIDSGQRKGSLQIAAQTQQHHLLTFRWSPPCAGITRAQRQPADPVGFKVARFHPTKPVFPVHFGDYTYADQIGDKAHDFG